MKLVDVKTMRELERIAIENYGVPSLLLMENAATGAVLALIAEIGKVENKNIHVFCGGGNNGGDGFAISRMLHNQNANVKITLLSDKNKVKGDAKTNLEICEKMGIPFVLPEECKDADIIVDAIFGTGFQGETKGDVKNCIDLINESGAYVLSVDIPSGVSADTGHASASSVCADLCVTFSAVKTGHLLFPGKNYYKKLVKTDISVPVEVINETNSGYDVIDKFSKKLLPKRQSNSHKGSFGKAYALVGSKGMSGAAILSSSAVLKSGAGVLITAVPTGIYEIVAKHIPSSMVFPLGENPYSEICEKLKTCDVLLAGCGLGTEDKTRDLIFSLITTFDKTIVLDADALNTISQNPDILFEKKGEIIITPHIAEFSRLSGLSVVSIKENPVDAARDFSQKYGVTVVLKDAASVVAEKSGHVHISSCSNSGMATAGSGDVLAGIITGLVAQGASPESASVCAVYLHLAAGEIAKCEKSEYGMTSEDILNAVPKAFKKEIDISPCIKEL